MSESEETKKKEKERMSTTSNSQDWEALPQRKKSRRDCRPTVSTSSSISGSGSGQIARTKPKNLDLINNAVSARAHANRAIATLDSGDGCAGENFECYLDHTADVQCHCWGKTLKEAFEFMGPCMFNYMTDLSSVDIDPNKIVEIRASGHDMNSLLFAYMDNLLDQIQSENFWIKQVKITSFDEVNFTLVAEGYGETHDPSKHPQGTDIKAITYSNMQIHVNPDRCDLYVIVDI